MPQIRLLDSVRHAIRVRQYSMSTEKAYITWIRRYMLFQGNRILPRNGVPESFFNFFNFPGPVCPGFGFKGSEPNGYYS